MSRPSCSGHIERVRAKEWVLPGQSEEGCGQFERRDSLVQCVRVLGGRCRPGYLVQARDEAEDAVREVPPHCVVQLREPQQGPVADEQPSSPTES